MRHWRQRPAPCFPHSHACAPAVLLLQARALLPEGGLKGMSVTLYATFWSLSLYDLEVPTQR